MKHKPNVDFFFKWKIPTKNSIAFSILAFLVVVVASKTVDGNRKIQQLDFNVFSLYFSSFFFFLFRDIERFNVCNDVLASFQESSIDFTIQYTFFEIVFALERRNKKKWKLSQQKLKPHNFSRRWIDSQVQKNIL